MTTPRPASTDAPLALHGRVLAGGASRRMGRDKAALVYETRPQLEVAFSLLQAQVQRCLVSVRADQQDDPLRARFPQLLDRHHAIGPAAGLLAAHASAPQAPWLVIACDLPGLEAATLQRLTAAFVPGDGAVAFRSAGDGLPEPLCALWAPPALQRLRRQVEGGHFGVRRALDADDVRLLAPQAAQVLDNANTPEDLARLRGEVRHG
ncbi:NTP transferase domain-containing protein [Pseudoxanthomonas sp. UC29_72]